MKGDLNKSYIIFFLIIFLFQLFRFIQLKLSTDCQVFLRIPFFSVGPFNKYKSLKEPATMLLLGFGILGLAGARRFRK